MCLIWKRTRIKRVQPLTSTDYSLYSGEFKYGPDQLVRNNVEFLYFTEDGGHTPGVYAIDVAARSYTIFEAYHMVHNTLTTKQQAWHSLPMGLKCMPVFKTAVAKCRANMIVGAFSRFGVMMDVHLMG